MFIIKQVFGTKTIKQCHQQLMQNDYTILWTITWALPKPTLWTTRITMKMATIAAICDNDLYQYVTMVMNNKDNKVQWHEQYMNNILKH